MEGTMPKSAHDDALSRSAGLLPGFEAMQPQAVFAAYEKAAVQAQDLSRMWMSSMQRSVDSSWDLCMALGRTGNPSDAMQMYRQWMNERRDAMIADGRDMAQMMFKLCQVDMGPITGGRETASEPANVSPMRSAAAGD
jgi:hypothetical protein